MREVIYRSRITGFQFDYALRVYFSRPYEEQHELRYIRIQSVFEIKVKGGEPQLVDPAAPVSAFPSLFKLRRAYACVSIEDSVLVIVSQDGEVELRVEPSDEYESWIIEQVNGGVIVCMPGGDIVRWSGEVA